METFLTKDGPFGIEFSDSLLDALLPRKRGPVAHKPDPAARRIVELEKENQKLSGRLRKAELIISAQKKIAEIFQTFGDQEEKNS